MRYLFCVFITLIFDYGYGFVCHEQLAPCLEIQENLTNFPKNQDQLAQTCTDLIDLTVCMDKAADSCKDDIPPEWRVHPDYYPAVLRNLSEICEEETALHNAILSHLPCYEQVIQTKSELCSEMAEDKLLKEGFTKKYDPLNYCITNSIKYICILENMEQTCGEEAESTAFEVLSLLKSMNNYCSSYYFVMLLEKVDDLDLEEPSKSRLLKLIETLQPDSSFPIHFT